MRRRTLGRRPGGTRGERRTCRSAGPAWPGSARCTRTRWSDIRLPHRAYLAEVDLEALYALASGGTAADPVSDEIGTASVRARPIGPTRLMRGLPRYPDVERDLAAVVPDDVPAARVEEVIREAAGPLLEAVELFDVYAGAPIPPGRRNLAYRLRFRAPDRTLVAGEAEEILDRVRIAVRVLAGVELRE